MDYKQLITMELPTKKGFAPSPPLKKKKKKKKIRRFQVLQYIPLRGF